MSVTVGVSLLAIKATVKRVSCLHDGHDGAYAFVCGGAIKHG